MMLTGQLQRRFGRTVSPIEAAKDDAIRVERDNALEVMTALKSEKEFGFDFLMDLTAVDWIGREPRFEVVYQLFSLSHGNRLRVKISVSLTDAWVHSVAGLWKSADWMERECFDMFGITFRGHPDLRRILLYDSFVGHPLRKDYPVAKRQPIVDEVDPILNPRRQSS